VQWRVYRQSVQCVCVVGPMRSIGAAANGDTRQPAADSCTFRVNPHFDLEPDYIIRMPIIHRIQRCNLRREILSILHTRVSTPFLHCIHPKLTLPLRRLPPNSNTPIPSPTPLTTPNGIRIQSAVLPLLTCADRQMGQTKALSHEHSAHRATR